MYASLNIGSLKVQTYIGQSNAAHFRLQVRYLGMIIVVLCPRSLQLIYVQKSISTADVFHGT